MLLPEIVELMAELRIWIAVVAVIERWKTINWVDPVGTVKTSLSDINAPPMVACIIQLEFTVREEGLCIPNSI